MRGNFTIPCESQRGPYGVMHRFTDGANEISQPYSLRTMAVPNSGSRKLQEEMET